MQKPPEADSSIKEVFSIMYDLGCTSGESRNQDGPLQRLVVGGPCPLAYRGNITGGSTGVQHERNIEMHKNAMRSG